MFWNNERQKRKRRRKREERVRKLRRERFDGNNPQAHVPVTKKKQKGRWS